MKKILVTILIIVSAVGIMSIAGTAGMDEVQNYRIKNVDMSSIENGEYDGECTLSRWALSVKVTVSNNTIENIVIADKKMSNISDELKTEYDEKLIGTKNPVFDTVSGATSVTGKAYMIAVANALHNSSRNSCDCFD